MRDWRRSPRWSSRSARPSSCGGASRGGTDAATRSPRRAGRPGAALDARPTDVPRPNFIRYCADDLKALYFEAYMIKTPAAGGDEITRWFWAETAVGQLLRRVRDRLDASDDPAAKAAAVGVARWRSRSAASLRASPR